ncbi:MAG: SlyX protein [Deltaproteobacteria bacterium]|nr:MAG: SlyX protein [Deltaproteobacteria bacterium]
MNEDRIVEIETRIAFQEETIKELNDVLYEQQKEIVALNAICDALMKRFKALSECIPQMDAPAHTKPPHY